MFDEWLDRHRVSREQTLELVRGTSQAQLDFRPAIDQWSIGEVLDHVALAEDRIRTEIQTAIEQVRAGGPAVRRLTFQDLECAPEFIPVKILSLIERPFGWVNRNLVSNRFKDLITRIRFFRIRHPSSAEPRHGLIAGTQEVRLWESFDMLEQLFSDNQDQDLSQITIIHPLLGRKNIIDLIRFSIAHEERHRNQIKRISKAYDARQENSTNSLREEQIA